MTDHSLFPQLSQNNSKNDAMTQFERKFAKLSKREKMVMTHLINGMSNKQIAEVLSFSEKPLILIKSGYMKNGCQQRNYTRKYCSKF